VDQIVAAQLLDLNRQFYQTFALQFSQTRQRIQPGVMKILKQIPKDASVLDLGCGNGELWQVMRREGFTGKYLGLDSSSQLLQIARGKLTDASGHLPIFLNSDLSLTDWEAPIVSLSQEKFDFILAFAVLHHLPGEDLRLRVIRTIAKLLASKGQFIHSEWQFFNNQRFISRVQTWQAINLSNEQVDEGDFLLDWRQGGFGLRYVHLFNELELSNLAERTNFTVSETFYSDGNSVDMGLYQSWVKSPI
jgi:tRNA (uracil-5-)-methyltransferase TRM9